jgi:hypothetical protein
MTCHPRRRDLALRYAEAPRQLPSLPPPSRANPTARANSELDKTWGKVTVAARSDDKVPKIGAGTIGREVRIAVDRWIVASEFLDPGTHPLQRGFRRGLAGAVRGYAHGRKAISAFVRRTSCRRRARESEQKPTSSQRSYVTQLFSRIRLAVSVIGGTVPGLDLSGLSSIARTGIDAAVRGNGVISGWIGQRASK